MAFEFSRNVVDSNLDETFALPASASASTNSTVIDLGADVYKGENYEVSLVVPALSATIVPDTRTVTYLIETSTTSAFSAVDRTVFTQTFTAAGGTGVAAQDIRVRLPSNSARYLRGKVTFGASTTDGSAVSATIALRF
jgi:hypothetical protein